MDQLFDFEKRNVERTNEEYHDAAVEGGEGVFEKKGEPVDCL